MLSIIERLEDARQRLTIIFPTGANFRPGLRSLSHLVPTLSPGFVAQRLGCNTARSTAFRQFIDRFSPRHVHGAEIGIRSATSSNASGQRRCTRTRYERLARKHRSVTAQMLCARVKAFFSVLRVDLASVGDLPRIRRHARTGADSPVRSSGIPAPKTRDVRTHCEDDARDRLPGLPPAAA